MDINKIYNINIYERFLDLKNSNKEELDNNDLWKIFEWYSCLELSKEYNKQFYEYDDIDPTFKEINKMSRNDTGIDCSDLDKTIVQCKLRKNALTWKECSTFFGSQNIFSSELNKTIVRWEKLIIARNNDSCLSEHLLERKELFIDRPYDKNTLINFCENLIINPPSYPIINNEYKLRDYQLESIELIKQNKKNVIISLPTGTGKNSVIIYSFENNKKYLILVPRIILMDQLKEEIIKHKPILKNKIQLIGDTNNKFNENKLITICVFNSVALLKEHFNTFEKIYIDEAHHINKPEIYYYDNEENDIRDNIEDIIEDNEENDYIEDEKDDTEDELVNVKTYTQIIKDLVQYNNNVYLSATIDKTNNFEYYNKDIREMINLGYLCDYTIHIPIYTEDPDNKKICNHLLQNYRNIIIYCNSQKEGKEINKLMNELQNNSSEYIDCNTPKKKRNDIITKYKKGDIPFLVNVRILVEGFDAPITKGVCFLHLPNNKTTLIQIIGRALRLHPTKTIANIILPFSSKEDEKNICNFLKVMAKNDSRIKKSFENKKMGGYISIEKEDVEDDNEDDNDNIEFKYNMIYSSMCKLQNGNEIWMKKLEEVKKYIDENEKRPSCKDKDTKLLSIWLIRQICNYKTKKYNMTNLEIYNKWTDFINDEKYKKYFQSNEDNWKQKLQQVIEYIDINKKKPYTESRNNDIQILGRWLSSQIRNYKTKQQIMSNPEIYNKWTDFINDEKYKKYFISNKDMWHEKLQQMIKYINTNNKKPSETDDNYNIKSSAKWIQTQIRNYKAKKNIMLDEEIYNKWTEFINDDKYKKYFISNEDYWTEKFKQLKDYIDTNKTKPSNNDKNKEIVMMKIWLNTQLSSYKPKTKIMSNPEIYNKWTDFINDDKYKIYFQSNEDYWKERLQQVIKYIDINNKRPSPHDKNANTRSIGQWISDQLKKYKTKNHIMSYPEIYAKWTNFINDDKYKKYFQSNEEIKEQEIQPKKFKATKKKIII